MQHKLILVGGGSGNKLHLLPAANVAMEQADCVIAAERLLPVACGKKVEQMGKISELLDTLPQRLEQESLCILVSGDPLLYSLCRSIQRRYPSLQLDLIPGVGSLQLLCVAFGLTMEDAKILSLHGRDTGKGTIAYAVATHGVSCFFCSKENGPRQIAEALLTYGLGKTTLYVGENLGDETERLWHGRPSAWQGDNPSLCVAAVYHQIPSPVYYPPLLPDRAFLRGNVPMTKEEVRSVVLTKLHLQPDHIVWDIGAGTGSVSVQCAKFCPYGKVYALEYKPDALKLLEKNKAYFQAENLEIIPGRAEQTMKNLPVPDCVFLGGMGGSGREIVEALFSLPKKIRIVASAVTMETQSQLYPLLSSMPEFEAVQLAISRGKTVGNYQILDGGHPVLLFCCETKR